MKKSWFAVLAVSFASHICMGAIVQGVKLPDEALVGSKTLKLNGTGVRQATILHINVYAAGLYLEKPSTDASEILSSVAVKQLEMVFLRDVGHEKLEDAWKDSFEFNCKSDCEKFQPLLKRLSMTMGDVKKSESFSFLFYSDRVELKTSRGKSETFANAPFTKLLLMTWLGAKPPTEDLKAGLLGKKHFD